MFTIDNGMPLPNLLFETDDGRRHYNLTFGCCLLDTWLMILLEDLLILVVLLLLLILEARCQDECGVLCSASVFGSRIAHGIWCTEYKRSRFLGTAGVLMVEGFLELLLERGLFVLSWSKSRRLPRRS
ncbi:uncharacterized protein [Triticum aestivum]|uniref:uncharacterized protein n=1 Tax=Triticum aestivum TaxID=4565 RepID=UPI001D00D05B|nr:uncharacterized protein LOC123187204 [Triticum aestivum]